jgi:hypothetical protein
MQPAPLYGAALALLVAAGARAQDSQPVGPPAPAASSATEAAANAAAKASVFKSGMIVRDPKGAVVGRIVEVRTTDDNRSAVVVDIDGQPIELSPALLTLGPAGDQALASMRKSDIERASEDAGQ